MIIQHIIIVRQRSTIREMDDAFIDRIMDLYLNFRRKTDDNTKHNVGDSVRSNDSATNESDKPIEGESDNRQSE